MGPQKGSLYISGLLTIFCVGGIHAQTTNTVVAEFDRAPAPGQKFSIVLRNTGPATTISGFSFKIAYDASQATLDNATDDTGLKGAQAEYTLGPVVEKRLANGTNVFRTLMMTTSSDLKNASRIAKLNLTAKPEYLGPFHFSLEDREANPPDGLFDNNMANIAHDFNVTALLK